MKKSETPARKARAPRKASKPTTEATTRKPRARKKPEPKVEVAEEKAPVVEVTVEEAVTEKVSIAEFFDEVTEEGRVYTRAELRDLKKRMRDGGIKREDAKLVLDQVAKVGKLTTEMAEEITAKLEEESFEDRPFSEFDVDKGVFKDEDGKAMTAGAALLQLCRVCLNGRQYVAALNHCLTEGEMGMDNHQEILKPIEDMEAEVAELNDEALETIKQLQLRWMILNKGYVCYTLPKDVKRGEDVVITAKTSLKQEYHAKVEKVFPFHYSLYRKVQEDGKLLAYSRPRPLVQDMATIISVELYTPVVEEVSEEA